MVGLASCRQRAYGVCRSRKGSIASGRVRSRGLGIHHHHLIAQLRGEPKVVGGDKDDRSRGARAAFPRSPRRRICGWIVTSSAVVGSSAITRRGLLENANAISTPLQHPAGQLMRVPTKQTTSIAEVRGGERRYRAFSPFHVIALAEPRQMFIELRADRHHRIERGHRLLRNKSDRPAKQGAPPGRRHLHQVFALKQQRTTGDGKAGAGAIGQSHARPWIFRRRILQLSRESFQAADRTIARGWPAPRFRRFALSPSDLSLVMRTRSSARFQRAARRVCAAGRRQED